MNIPLIKSTFYKEDDTKKLLCDFILSSQKLSMGTQCEQFEKKFAQWQGRKYCISFNSGSSANLALIQGLCNLNILHKNDLVGFSAITWATNVMPLYQLSLQPVPIDIERETLNISFETVKKVHGKTPLSCIFLTNLLGFSDNIDSIKEYCTKENILLIEDNCEALGSEYKGIKLGNFGFASTFSFFVGHHLSTIEGGAICTDNKELDTMLRMVRSHGWDRHMDAETRTAIHKKHVIDEFNSKYAFYDLAFNIRPTEIQGFLGVNQLQYLNETIARRENNFIKMKIIYEHNGVLNIRTNHMDIISNFAMPIICTNKNLKEELLSRCKNNGIETRPIVGGVMSQQPFYKKYTRRASMSDLLPNAQFVHLNGFYVGNNPEMTPEEIDIIIHTLSLE